MASSIKISILPKEKEMKITSIQVNEELIVEATDYSLGSTTQASIIIKSLIGEIRRLERQINQAIVEDSKKE